MHAVRLALALALVVGCRDRAPTRDEQRLVRKRGGLPTLQKQPFGVEPTDASISAALEKARDQYLEDASAFLKVPRDQVLAQIRGTPMKEEWEAWEKSGPMTDDRIKAFYKQTKSYIYDLGLWHLYDPAKYDSDMALVEELKAGGTIKNVLDFGGGVGFNAFPLAEGGFDVTLADLDSVTLDFAAYRATKHGIRLKYWKTDVEPMPPDKKYDAILCLDVLEHLPEAILIETVDKLVKLKHAGTKILIHAPFGKTSVHPMHLDATEVTRRQIERLQYELATP